MHVPSSAQSQSAHALLRASFAQELSTRLPRIVLREDLEAVRRDVHTLASSAWVVGEPEISQLARQAEDDLTDEHLDALVTVLQAWSL